MRLYRELLPAGLLITVTATPTSILDLINTAGSTTIDFPKDLNWAKLNPKNGHILYLQDRNDPDNSTTPETGVRIFQNDDREVKGAPINELILQRVGGTDVEVVVQIGWTDNQGN